MMSMSMTVLYHLESSRIVLIVPLPTSRHTYETHTIYHNEFHNSYNTPAMAYENVVYSTTQLNRGQRMPLRDLHQ